jgi:hypothetical protein
MDIKTITEVLIQQGEQVANDWLDALIAEGKIDEIRPITRKDVRTLLQNLGLVIQQNAAIAA